MASTSLAKNESEYKFAAAMGDFEYELTKATLYDLDVPANAEFVIEGEIMPFERCPEGPFGEFPGSYSGVTEACRMHVKRVTHRINPSMPPSAWPASPKGEREHSGTEHLFRSVSPAEEGNARCEGCQRHVSARHDHHHLRQAPLPRLCQDHRHAAGQHPHGTDYCRNIIVVDDEVDPFNLNEVMWALSTRVRRQRRRHHHPRHPRLAPCCPRIPVCSLAES